MANEQWMMEWVDASHIRTFEKERAGEYRMLRPQMSDTFDVQSAQPADYERYWAAWTKYAGYTEEEKIDLCFVCPDGINIDDFLAAAKAGGIRVASPTEWAISDVLECLEQAGNYAKAETSDTPPVKITLDYGLYLYAYSGDGSDFHPSEFRESVAPISEMQYEETPDGDVNDLPSRAEAEETVPTSDAPAQATKEEIREAIRRISEAQCRTIDNKR